MIDTFNKYMVGMRAGGIVIMLPPPGPISNEEALVLAAWLVSLADFSEGHKAFLDVLEQLQE
jgi:hypothetical protein